MNVLVACEYSGRVRDAFASKGHYALSCDLLPSESENKSYSNGGIAEHHQGSIWDILGNNPKMNSKIKSENAKNWDLLLAFPPCTYLAASGMHWTTRGYRDPQLTEDALEFVDQLLHCGINKICLENPIGVIATRIRKPDQIIQPYNFGEDASKKTCLWLDNLPKLEPTEYYPPRYVCCGITLDTDDLYSCPNCNGENRAKPRWSNQLDSGQSAIPERKGRWQDKSRTYQGIADAMAMQWG